MKRAYLIIVALMLSAIAHAQTPGATPSATARPHTTAAPSAAADAPQQTEPPGAASGTPATPAGALPPGHPPTGQMPPGHPPTGQMPPGHPPTGRTPPGHPSGARQPPRNSVLNDKELPPGTIDIQILDSSGRPVPNAPITLAILFSSVTKGESRERKVVTADEMGRFRFSDMKRGSGTSYRIVSNVDEASFASDPFGLKDEAGIRVKLHVFPPIRDLAKAPFVMEAVVIIEIKDESIAINHLLRTLNVGNVAYVPTGVRMALPEDAKAFNTGDSMEGQGIIERDGSLELVGTYPPGQTEMTYRYQVPRGTDAMQRLKLPLPPRVVATRVMVGANAEMSMRIAGFPDANPNRLTDGKRVLETTRKVNLRGGMAALMANTSPQLLEVEISGLPTPGSTRLVSLLLAIAAIFGGLYYLYSTHGDATLFGEQRRDLEDARDTLLDEIALLHRAKRTGTLGPRTFARVRDALMDALARIVDKLDEAARTTKKTKKSRRKAKAKG